MGFEIIKDLNEKVKRYWTNHNVTMRHEFLFAQSYFLCI